MTYEESLTVVLFELKELLLKKHHDYGSANLLKHGMFGISVRLDDKLARFQNLLKNNGDASVTDEKISDTLFDIAGYAIQAILIDRDELK